jgi:Fibronectin type III domain
MVCRLSAPVWFGRAVLLLLGVGACVTKAPCSVPTPSTGSVMLAWNPSISTNVAGYKVYHGVASGVYNNTNYVTGSTSTNATVTGLVQGVTYYFAATAVDALGVESPFSNETIYSVPTNSKAATLVTVAAPANGQFAMTVNGVTGYNYVVQVSSNLVNWTSVLTNTAPFTFVDVNASQFSQRFYRSYYLP